MTFVVVGSVSDLGEPSPSPIAGAAVAFDAPGGARVEQMTGADGKVTFTGIDWSKGKAAATTYVEGHALMSLVNLDEARLAKERHIDDAVALLLVAPAAPETVGFQGTLAGVLDPAHGAWVRTVVFPGVVNPNSAYEWQGSAGGAFSLSVPKGAPFVLQAAERGPTMPLPSGQGHDVAIYQVMEQSFDATSANTNGIVLDFSTHALATHVVDIQIATPPRAESPVRLAYGDHALTHQKNRVAWRASSARVTPRLPANSSSHAARMRRRKNQ